MRNFRRVFLAILALGSLTILTACGNTVSGFGYPKGNSSVNDNSLPLWQGAMIAALVVGAITLVLILYPVFRHRRKANGPEFPKQTQYNIPTEIAYTVIPFLIVAVLFAFTAKVEAKVTKVSPTATHSISVNGIQWSWQFTYNDMANPVTVTGTPANPPTLVLPQGEAVKFTLTSSDVVHGFMIPDFMIQLQNLPHVENHLEFTANKLGTFRGFCDILCGRDHSRMRFYVKVVSPADYQTYLSTLKAA